MEETTADFIPGMGLGASEQVKRWAWIGYCAEVKDRIFTQTRTPRGRPRKEKIANMDSFRAFNLWSIMRNIRKRQSNAKLSNRELIHIMRQAERALGIPNSERTFPDSGNFESSISNGKRNLGIDKNWHSELCEKISLI